MNDSIFHTFLLTLKQNDANIIYSWCCKQFGEEFISWKYVYGGGYSYSDGKMDQTFIVKELDNIALFELTWGELRRESIK